MIYGLIAELVPVVAWSMRCADVSSFYRIKRACQELFDVIAFVHGKISLPKEC
jgi:hypothetical protein